MGPTALCEHCSKKLTLFTKRRRCRHCRAVVCRGCYEPHAVARHPNTAALSSGVDDDDVHFTSPTNAEEESGRGSSFREFQDESTADLLDGADDGEGVDGEENDDEDEEDGGEEEMMMGLQYGRRASYEEEETQFREFVQIQHAVEKWTRKELDIKRQERSSKQLGAIYVTKPVPNLRSVREYQLRELFGITYGVFVTLIVWCIGGIGLLVYLHFRTRLASTLAYSA
ncbi:hypothetical protein Poli38472_010949 [Pythium oligandrum]|uniref:Uncharacterized protein n=1 Tax=Pythium oligandrum TaxID=41045 RepID=A0A8K1CFH5_PYTOL|nr:hypothetical protein Poli38472_010949 [Pythium oligandrum]|eukprot:TMW61886.1 hypothetical protein Poli38472_010949 [Pythium oligandrum]